MKVSQAFPSKYLKAADLSGRKIGVTIDSVEMANIGDDQDKLVVYFADKSKGLVLNVTNANMIAEIAGTDETDNWRGVRIALFATKVDFQGRRVDAIRVDYPIAANGQSQHPVAGPAAAIYAAHQASQAMRDQPQSMKDQEQKAPLADDDIPF